MVIVEFEKASQILPLKNQVKRIDTSNDRVNNESSNKSIQIVKPNNAEELQAKIRKVAATIVEFYNIEQKNYRDVKQQLLEIMQDAQRLEIGRDELRRMLVEEMSAAGPRGLQISESYLRRLLPSEYKYTSKTRLDYKAKRQAEERKIVEDASDQRTGQPQVDGMAAEQTTMYEQHELENLQQNKTVIKQQRPVGFPWSTNAPIFRT